MISSIIGKRIRAYRLRAGLTQESLAEKANVHPTYIGQVERGEKNLTITTLEKIRYALDISYREIFDHISLESSKESIPAQCYELILQMPASKQQHVYQILLEIDKLTKE